MKLTGKNQVTALAFFQRHRGWQTFAIKDRTTRLAVSSLAKRKLIEISGDQARYVEVIRKNPRSKNKGRSWKVVFSDGKIATVTASDYKSARSKARLLNYSGIESLGLVTSPKDKRKQRAQAIAAFKARKNPSDAARGRAEDLLYAFTGGRATKELTVEHKPIKTGLVVGKLSGVMYEADRGDGMHAYFHRFEKKARPLLIADHDGSQLGIVGGRFQFTDRGIVDE